MKADALWISTGGCCGCDVWGRVLFHRAVQNSGAGRRESWKVQGLQRQRAAKRPDHINVSVAGALPAHLYLPPSAAARDTPGLVAMHPHPSNSEANGSW